jgi:hypothetical protein
MRTNIFKTAAALSDADLLARTQAFANEEREATAELVAHLAVLENRPSAYAALGHGSLFGYCTEALGLSEDAACNRIAAARWCRQFPAIADLMASGAVSLTTVRLLGPHLTPENLETVLARASRRRRADILALVAELAPQPDVPASVRKLPAPRPAPEVATSVDSESGAHSGTLWEAGVLTGAPSEVLLTPEPSLTPEFLPPPQHGPARASASVQPVGPGRWESAVSSSAPPIGGAPAPALPAPRPIVQPSAPGRYRVQFTMGRESHDELRRLQALLRREIPSGDPGLIFVRALHLLLERVEKAKLGKAGRRKQRAIRSGTDNDTAGKDTSSATVPRREGASGDAAPNQALRTEPARSRRIPAAVRAAVWKRDGAQCAFVGGSGNRCMERSFLEFHHVQPFALEGPPTIGNIALRCRRHNQYEGELDFGAPSSQKDAEMLHRDRTHHEAAKRGRRG